QSSDPRSEPSPPDLSGSAFALARPRGAPLRRSIALSPERLCGFRVIPSRYCTAIYAQHELQHEMIRGARPVRLRRSKMDELLVDGGVIRKLWIGETGQSREPLLRLDRDSRRSRFGGAVADELVAAYAETAARPGVVLHGFLIEGTLRGAGELRLLSPSVARQAEVAFSIE